MSHATQRRQFLIASAATVGGIASGMRSGFADQATATKPATSTGWLSPTLKIGMIRQGDSLAEKFSVALDAGFTGVELNTPGFDVEQARKASETTGLIIDGTVGGYHWKIRHTDPDPSIRDEALKNLHEGIRKTADVGADTMLLVPGHGKDGTKQEVNDRAVSAIEAALPQAEKSGVRILIENVWNEMFYDKDGGDDQTADALAKFIDHFDSPLVGVQYDIGNHWKYGNPDAWIRTLGKRIMKLDIKGYSRSASGWAPITQGDIDWPAVKQALRDIEFTGWLAAEVSGGDLDALKTVRDQMETALACREEVA